MAGDAIERLLKRVHKTHGSRLGSFSQVPGQGFIDVGQGLGPGNDRKALHALRFGERRG
jgi:hypothetical protein